MLRFEHRSLGQLVYQPAVDGAEAELSGPFKLLRTFVVPQDPGRLGRREVGRKRDARLLPDALPECLVCYFIRDLLRPGALPDDGVLRRLSRLPIPGDGGLPLIGEPDGGHAVLVDGRVLHELPDYVDAVAKNLFPVVADPAFGGDDLLMGQESLCDDLALPVHQDRFGALGALIEANHVSVQHCRSSMLFLAFILSAEELN